MYSVWPGNKVRPVREASVASTSLSPMTMMLVLLASPETVIMPQNREPAVLSLSGVPFAATLCVPDSRGPAKAIVHRVRKRTNSVSVLMAAPLQQAS